MEYWGHAHAMQHLREPYLTGASNQYHIVFAAYARARMFDTWSYASKHATYKNSAGQVVPAPQPDEHQSEFVASGGGPIPFTRHKGFFYVTYNKYHGHTWINPNFLTVPTTLMRQGIFSEHRPPRSEADE